MSLALKSFSRPKQPPPAATPPLRPSDAIPIAAAAAATCDVELLGPARPRPSGLEVPFGGVGIQKKSQKPLLNCFLMVFVTSHLSSVDQPLRS